MPPVTSAKKALGHFQQLSMFYEFLNFPQGRMVKFRANRVFLFYLIKKSLRFLVCFFYVFQSRDLLVFWVLYCIQNRCSAFTEPSKDGVLPNFFWL